MIITQLTPEMERRLREPVPGSRIEAARDFGIDLTLLIGQLRLTPEQRVRKLQQGMKMLAQIQGAARRKKVKAND